MIIIIDDFLDKDLIISSITEFKDITQAPEMVKSILDKAGDYFDLSEMNFYEAWTNENTIPNGWHYDRDVMLFDAKREVKYPLCSTVFYPAVENVVRGKLLFENGVKVKPKFNRLVIFSPGLYHGVEPFVGKRISININPWSDPIYGWTGNNESSIK